MSPAKMPIGRILAAAFLLHVVLLTQGCANLPSIPGVASEALPPDPGDPCQQERATFAASNDFFTADVLQSAGAAALLGAETPLKSSFSTSGFHLALNDVVKDAVTQFVGSTKASMMNSYSAYVRQQTGGDRSEMASRVGSDLEVEGKARDRTIQNFTALRDCRFSQAAMIKQQLRDHTTTRKDARQALDTEKTWFDQEIALATKWGVNMRQRDEQFAEAAEMAQPSGPSRPSGRSGAQHRYAPRAPQGEPIVVEATETIPDKREALVGTVSQAKAESATAFNVEGDDQGMNRLPGFLGLSLPRYA